MFNVLLKRVYCTGSPKTNESRLVGAVNLKANVLASRCLQLVAARLTFSYPSADGRSLTSWVLELQPPITIVRVGTRRTRSSITFNIATRIEVSGQGSVVGTIVAHDQLRLRFAQIASNSPS